MLGGAGSSDQDEVLPRAGGLGVGPSLSCEDTLLTRDAGGASGRSGGRVAMRCRHSSCGQGRGVRAACAGAPHPALGAAVRPAAGHVRREGPHATPQTRTPVTRRHADTRQHTQCTRSCTWTPGLPRGQRAARTPPQGAQDTRHHVTKPCRDRTRTPPAAQRDRGQRRDETELGPRPGLRDSRPATQSPASRRPIRCPGFGTHRRVALTGPLSPHLCFCRRTGRGQPRIPWEDRTRSPQALRTSRSRQVTVSFRFTDPTPGREHILASLGRCQGQTRGP